MSDLRELYQEVIFDHNRKPRNFGRMACPTCQADGVNPLCGDRLTLYVQVEGNVIRDLSFEGSGCAISTASASLLTETLKGKTIAEADALFHGFHDLVTGHADGHGPDLGKLEVLGGVAEFPARVKCATLAWHTLQAALRNENRPATTE